MIREACICLALMLAERMPAKCQAPPQPILKRPVALRGPVVVHGEQLRLSDLLPEDAPQTLRSQSQSISIGLAPLPGSFRLLRRAELKKTIAGKVPLSVPDNILVVGGGWPIRPAAVQETLRTQHALPPDVRISAIHLPIELMTREQNPALKVVAVSRGADDRHITVFMKCELRSLCAPFVAELALGDADGWSPAARSGPHRRKVANRACVRPGRTAVLLIEGIGIKIRMRVLPLSLGALGDTVRVFDPVSRHVLQARVQGENLLFVEFGGGA